MIRLGKQQNAVYCVELSLVWEDVVVVGGRYCGKVLTEDGRASSIMTPSPSIGAQLL